MSTEELNINYTREAFLNPINLGALLVSTIGALFVSNCTVGIYGANAFASRSAHWPVSIQDYRDERKILLAQERSCERNNERYVLGTKNMFTE